MTQRKPNAHRTGLSHKLRDYLREHPGSTSAQVAAALGGDTGTIGRTLVKMRKQGHLTGTLLERTTSRDSLYAYTLAREPLRPHLSPEEAAQRRKERRVAYDRKQTERKRLRRQEARAALRDERLPRVVPRPAMVPPPVYVEPETVEQWEARGGRKEVLQGFVYQPDLRRRGVVGYRHGAAA